MLPAHETATDAVSDDRPHGYHHSTPQRRVAGHRMLRAVAAAPATNACTSVSQGRMSRRISPARPASVNSVRDVPQVDARMFYVWSPLHAQYWSVL